MYELILFKASRYKPTQYWEKIKEKAVQTVYDSYRIFFVDYCSQWRIQGEICGAAAPTKILGKFINTLKCRILFKPSI